MNIVWDQQRTRYTSDRYALTLWTGESTGLRNRLTVLRLTAPREAIAIEQAIMKVAEDASQQMGGTPGDYPGVPEIISWRAMTSRGELAVCIAWGIIPNGAVQRGVMHGDYRFVIVLEDELDECLSRVFQLERMMTP